MEKKIGFIGCGNMGTAMIQGILESGKCPPQEMMISCRTKKTLEEKKAQFGVQISTDNRDVAAFADILFVAVKPQFYAEVLEEIKDLLTEEQILVSIAPGKTLVWFDEVLGRNLKVIRTMPNTPSMVKEGMMGMCAGARVTDADMALVRDLCSGFSQTEVIPEHLMDVVTAVSGSSPAYVLCLLKPWQMQQWLVECRDSRRTNLQHRRYLEVQRWFLRRENIRENLKIWYALRQEPPFRQCVCWRKKACAAA